MQRYINSLKSLLDALYVKRIYFEFAPSLESLIFSIRGQSLVSAIVYIPFKSLEKVAAWIRFIS